MAKLTAAKKRRFPRMLAQLTTEQRRAVLHVIRLIQLRQFGDRDVESEIAGMLEAGEDWRILRVPTMH